MLRACCLFALILGIAAGCNSARDDEEYEETGLLRIPASIPAAPDGMVAAAGDRFYLFVPAGWTTTPHKFDESQLHKGNRGELLDGDWKEAGDEASSARGTLNVYLHPNSQTTFEQQANEVVETYRKMPDTTVGHVENSLIALNDGTPAHLLVMIAQSEEKQLSELMTQEGGHYLFVYLWVAVNRLSYWQVNYIVSSDSEHDLVRHDSDLGQSLIASVKSLKIVPDAQGSPMAPR